MIDLKEDAQSGHRTYDLSIPEAGYKLSLTPEENKRDASMRRTKDMILFLSAVAFLIMLAGICIGFVLDESAVAEDKKWAMSFLTGLGGGLVGYLLKK